MPSRRYESAEGCAEVGGSMGELPPQHDIGARRQVRGGGGGACHGCMAGLAAAVRRGSREDGPDGPARAVIRERRTDADWGLSVPPLYPSLSCISQAERRRGWRGAARACLLAADGGWVGLAQGDGDTTDRISSLGPNTPELFGSSLSSIFPSSSLTREHASADSPKRSLQPRSSPSVARKLHQTLRTYGL